MLPQHNLGPINEEEYGPIAFSLGGGFVALHDVAATQSIEYGTTIEMTFVVPPEVSCD